MSDFRAGGFYYEPWEIPLDKFRIFGLWTVTYIKQKIALRVSVIVVRTRIIRMMVYFDRKGVAK